MRSRVRAAVVALVALVALSSSRALAQDLGHKLLGTLGLKAGAQPKAGLYLVDRMAFFESHALYDRTGARVPVDISSQAFANAIGVTGAYELPRLKTFVNATVAVPIARVVGSVGGVAGSIDRFGLADTYIQPLRLGWHLPRVDVVAGYAFYVPTRRFSPGGEGGVSRGSWSHELSLGATLFLDEKRTFHISALASYEHNERKQGIDITRGATVQIQGGAGKTLFRVVDAGVVGYALWQVTDDTGSALPPVLRGARDRTFGLGAELGLTITDARTRFVLRYTHDVAVRSRPAGQLFVIGVTFAAGP
jgi:hypothetical protein